MLEHRLTLEMIQEVIEDLDPTGTIRTGRRSPTSSPSVSPSPLPPTTARTIRRAKGYLAKLPPSVEGSNGSSAMLYACSAMLRGFCLDRETARELIADHYNARAVPPWSQREIEHKLDSAEQRPISKARGWLLEGGAA